ncbi:MAG: glycosyltransferase family A protein [Phormidium sp.]
MTSANNLDKLSMNSTVISVIIPALNRVKFLEQAIDSVRHQTFSNWELLIVDDGSNQETVERILLLSKEEPRIKYIKRQRQQSGAPASRNEGTEVSQGKYIIYLDSDDWIAPKALENRFREMEQHPELDFGVFPCVLFREQPGDMNIVWNIPKSENDIDRFLYFDPPWQTTSPIWRREALEKIGLWDESLPSWQDWEFHLRALINNLQYQHFQIPDCFWRVPQQESIGLKSMSPEHLKAQENLFYQTHQHLKKAKLLNKNRQLLCGSLFLFLAELWVYQNELSPGLRVWQFCHENDIVEQPFYSQGIWYLKILDFWYSKIKADLANGDIPRRVMRRLTRIYFEVLWPKGLMPKWSKTFRKAPLPPEYQLGELGK